MLNGDNTGTSSAGYAPVTTKDIKKMLAGYDFTNKQSVLRDKSNKPMPVNTGYKKALPAVQGVETAPPGQPDFGGVQSLPVVKDKTTNFAPSVSRKDYVREYQRIHGGSEKAANMAYNLNKAKSFKTTELASGRDVVTSPAYRQTNGKSLLSRAADTVSGGLKGSAAGNTNALATIYQAGQTGRTVQNNKFLADKSASLETARRDLALMLEDNAAGTGGWSAGDIKIQRDMIAALQSEADAMRFVVDGNVQQNAAVTAQNEADAIQQSAGRDIESAKEGLGWLGSHVVDAGAAMTQVVGDMAAGVALGGIGGSAPFVARSFGGGAQGARQDGADLEGQLLYGGAEAAKEYLTEKMFGLALPFSKAYGSGSMDDVVKKGIQKAVDKFAKTEAGKQWLGRGLNFAAASLSEGAEELIGNFIGWQMPRLYGGEPERFSDMLANAFSEAVTGAMTGAMGAAVTPGSYHYDGGENDGAGIKADTSLFNRNILNNLTKARTAFIAYAKEVFPKSVINKNTGREIDISRNGLDKLLSGNIGYEKYASAFHVPELVENAVKVSETKNYHDNNTATNIPTYEYFDSPIEIDGKLYNVHIRVRNTMSGDKYYGHTLSEIDDIKIEEPSARALGDFSPKQSVNAIEGSYNTNIARSARGVNNIIRSNPAVDAIEKIHYPDSEPVITRSNRATVESGKASGVGNVQGEQERFSDMLANAFSEAVTGAMTGAIGAAVTPGSYHYDGGKSLGEREIGNATGIINAERSGAEHAKKQSTFQNFMGQIVKAMRGEMPSDTPILVGETPEILQQYGAQPRTITLYQSEIRKIAYPDGYMGGET